MTYVQRWLLAISLFITLLLIGVLASFVLTPRTNAQPAAVTVQTATTPTISQSSNLLSEADVTQKVAQLLPAQSIEQLQKVNYQGVLAYEITTQANQLYVDRATGNVLALTNRAPQGLTTAQYTYQGDGDHDEGEGEEDDD